MAVKTKAKKFADREAKVVGTEVMMIPVGAISGNTAQSRGMGVLSTLKDQGWGLFEQESAGKKPIWDLLVSDQPEDRQQAIDLINEHEPWVRQMAESLAEIQLQPIGVIKMEDDTYDVIYGMSRVLAIAYNYAVNEDNPDSIESKVYDFDGQPSKAQLKLLALKENTNRREESPIDRAITYRDLKKEGLEEKEIAQRSGVSVQLVNQYLQLLHKLLEDKRMDIHTGKLKIDPAIKLLKKRKEGKEGGDDNRGSGDKSANRFRLPGVKGVIRILESGNKPKSVSDELWDFYINPVVREFLITAFGLGNAYLPVPEPKKPKEKKGEKGKKEKGEEFTVRRKKAEDLMVDLGFTDARTWGDDVLAGKLSNIQNEVGDGERPETESLEKLFDTLWKKQTEGVPVRIVKDDAGKKSGKKHARA